MEESLDSLIIKMNRSYQALVNSAHEGTSKPIREVLNEWFNHCKWKVDQRVERDIEEQMKEQHV